MTGLVTWHFVSLDPATLQLLDDPAGGFLPPDTSPPVGEGRVLFTVAPKAGLPTGAQIQNQESIVFDTNGNTEAALATPDVTRYVGCAPSTTTSTSTSTTSTSSSPVASSSTSTTVSAPTTTTTTSAPPCGTDATFASIECRARTLAGHVGGASDLGTAAPGPCGARERRARSSGCRPPRAASRRRHS